MKDSIRLGFSGVGLILMTGVATAAPVVLDTEQKAAAGVATALSMSSLPLSVNSSVDHIRDLVHFTLQTVSAATTPAALMSTPGGVTINCAVSGTVVARMENALPRILRVHWRDCVTIRFRREYSLDGPAAITLPADTFQPQNVLAIRFGNAATELRMQYRDEMEDRTDTTTSAFRIALNGDISMTRWFDCCEWIGTSAFEMRGYHDDILFREYPDGAPSEAMSSRLSAQRLTVLRTTNNVEGMSEDDSRYLGGAYVRSTTGAYGVGTYTYRFNDYQVHRIHDYDAWTEQLSVNGRITVEQPLAPGSGCMNGLYAFQTRAPLISPLNTGRHQDGELAVNGSVVASFYSSSNTPPTLPTPANGMLLSLQLRDVGTFNYDVASTYAALMPVGQCSPF